MGIEKDLVKMSSFVLDLIIVIAAQEREDAVFDTCVPNIVSGKSRVAS